jgi:hypothetical protein
MPRDVRDDDLPAVLSYASIIHANLDNVNVKSAVKLLMGGTIFGAVTDCVEESMSKVKSPVGKSKVKEIFSKTIRR